VNAPASPVSATASPPTGPEMVAAPKTRRNTELALLIFVMLVVLAYSVANEVGLTKQLSTTFWVLPALLFVAFFGFHVVVRRLAPSRCSTALASPSSGGSTWSPATLPIRCTPRRSAGTPSANGSGRSPR
jgi:hypothetical protein